MPAKKKPAAPASPIAVTLPKLKKGEIHVGVTSVGLKLHHVILLPGDNPAAPWKKQLEWAKKQGGDLPSRPEQAMLLAECMSEFEKEWYWSNTRHATHSDFAWLQGFYYGFQGDEHVGSDYRARAVRRVPIQ